MAEHPGVTQLQAGFEAFTTGNMHALSELFADDIVWVVPGKNPLSGTYKGKIELFGFFGNFIRESRGTWRNELRDVLANDRHSVALIHATAKRNDKTIDQNGVAVFDVNDRGKIIRAVFLWEDQAAVDDFYVGELA
ncbi:MAG TPA: nuclear transport factor 2 family protein [Actinomycetota bacterium]|nr:nuclear transport factor 2 family protein [Actinomycetota bacterium]